MGLLWVFEGFALRAPAVWERLGGNNVHFFLRRQTQGVKLDFDCHNGTTWGFADNKNIF